MTYSQPNRSPECCRKPLCGYLEQRTVGDVHHDRCAHGIPMHGPSCAWHRTPEQIAMIAATEQAAASRHQEKFSKRTGL